MVFGLKFFVDFPKKEMTLLITKNSARNWQYCQKIIIEMPVLKSYSYFKDCPQPKQ